jgi:hypothetical protein
VSDLPAVRASDADRELSVARLREAAADGRLTLDEFTERMHAVYAARAHDELETLLHDLPERAAERVPATRRAISVMGNCVVDLRGAAGEVEVRAACVMGNVTVLVPRSANVDLRAVAFMGNREVRGQREDGDGPSVHVTGFVVMGNLEVRRR